MQKSTKNYRWWQYYLLEFLLFGGLIALLFALHQKMLIWSADGFIMFHTTAQYSDTFWTNLLHGQLTVMDLHIGEGLNPLHFMTYYGLLEPWNVLYAITPDSWTIYIESVFVVGKLFISGLAFGYYAKRYSKDAQVISIGALIYVTSGYFMMWMSTPSLLNAGFVLPLLLCAFEASVQKQRHMWFLLLTAFAYITNYYVAAILSLMLLTYGIIYLSTHHYWNEWKRWVPTVCAHALGILMAMWILLPCICAILNSARSTGNTGVESLLVYPWQYYLNMLHQLFMPNADTVLYWKHPYQPQLNFLPIALPCVVHLFLTKQHAEHIKRMKWLLCTFGLFLCVPVFALLFNGASYATHRWTVALSMLIGMISVWALPQLKIDAKMRCIIWGYTGLAILSSFFFADTPYIIVASILMLLIAGFMTLSPLHISIKIIQRTSIIGFVLCGLVLNYSLGQYNDAQTYVIQEWDYYAHLQDKTYLDKRAGQSNNLLCVNTGAAHQHYTNTAGWNLISTSESEYYTNAQLLPDMLTPSWLAGTDDRSAIQVLSGVEYYITTDTSMQSIPIGFEHLYSVSTECDYGNLHVYQNTCNPGIGYMYSQSMSQDQFYQLNIAARQLALMQYAIVQESADVKVPNSITLPYTVEYGEKQITLTTDIPEGYEVYLYCDNTLFHYTETWKVDAMSSEHANPDAISITVNGSANDKQVYALWPERHLALQHGVRTVCLGAQLAGITTIEIACDDTVTIGEMQLFAFPISDFQSAAQALKSNSLRDVQYDSTAATLTGEITAPDDGVLQIAIPYSTGWKAYVDGQQVDTFTSGIKYIGINVTEGEHTIELRYHTPGLAVGCIVSCIATGIAIVWIAMEIHRKKSKRR